MGGHRESYASELPAQSRAELARCCGSISRFRDGFLANPMAIVPQFPGEGTYSLVGGSDGVDHGHEFHGCLWSEG